MIRPVIRRESGWLVCDAPLSKGVPVLRDARTEDVATTLLGASALLPAGCKFALVGASNLRVRAEQPDPPEPDLTARMAEMEAGFEAAADPFGGAWAAQLEVVDLPNDLSTLDVASLCREASWPFEQRPDGAVVVDIGLSGSYVPAVVEARASGIAVETDLVARIPTAATRRAALAALLLRANGAYRMVRAVIRSSKDESRALLEAPLSVDASAVEFSLALGSVAVAAQHCAAEAEMLATDERLARAFLSRCRSMDRPAAMPMNKSSIHM